MNETKAKAFFGTKSKYFMKDEEVDEELMNAVLAIPEAEYETLFKIPFKSPIKTLGYAVFLGFLGWDQSYLGERKQMLIKLFTLGGLGILWVKDVMSALDRCRTYNRKLLKACLKDINWAKSLIRAEENFKKAKRNMLKTTVKGTKDIFNSFTRV